MTALPLPHPSDLAARLFRALYPQFELRSLGGLHVAVPAGTVWYAGRSLSEIACQISAVPALRPHDGLDGQQRSRSAGSR